MRTLPTSSTAKPNKIKTLSDTQNPQSQSKPNRMKTLHTFRPGKGPSLRSQLTLELMEHEERPGHQTAESSKVIPVQLVAKIKRGEHPKHRQRDHLLNHLQLIRREGLRADPVGRYLQAVLKEGDAPTDQNHLPKRHLAKLQVPVPREGHKNVRANQQQNGPHGRC